MNMSLKEKLKDFTVFSLILGGSVAPAYCMASANELFSRQGLEVYTSQHKGKSAGVVMVDVNYLPFDNHHISSEGLKIKNGFLIMDNGDSCRVWNTGFGGYNILKTNQN